MLSIVRKGLLAPKHPRQRRAGGALSACLNVMRTHVLKCSINGDLWQRFDLTRAADAAGFIALLLLVCMLLVGFRWYGCGRCAERRMVNVCRHSRSRAHRSISGSGNLCMRAGWTCVLANAHCAVQTVCIYCLAIDALVGSMEKRAVCRESGTRQIRFYVEPDLQKRDMLSQGGSWDRFGNTLSPFNEWRLVRR